MDNIQTAVPGVLAAGAVMVTGFGCAEVLGKAVQVVETVDFVA